MHNYKSNMRKNNKKKKTELNNDDDIFNSSHVLVLGSFIYPEAWPVYQWQSSDSLVTVFCSHFFLKRPSLC